MKSKFPKTRKRYIALALLLSYVVVCQSCVTMRSTAEETREFFSKANVGYVDTTVVVHRYKLHYIETGNRDLPTLFFVHGSPGSWDAYERYLSDRLLLKKYRMIAVDRPGFGYSDYGEAQALEVQSTLLTELVRQTSNDKPLVLIGHSLGGPIIVKMAADHPELFAHLVVLAGSVDPAQEGNPAWRAVVGARPLRYLIPGAMRTSNDELLYLRGDLEKLRPKLKNITSDVTIVHGTQDPLVPFANAAYMKKEFRNARSVAVIPIEKANHFIPWEHYGEVRGVLLGLHQ